MMFICVLALASTRRKLSCPLSRQPAQLTRISHSSCQAQEGALSVSHPTLQSLHIQQNKLNKDPELAKKCCAQMDDYIRKGYARKLTKEEAHRESTKTCTKSKKHLEFREMYPLGAESIINKRYMDDYMGRLHSCKTEEMAIQMYKQNYILEKNKPIPLSKFDDPWDFQMPTRLQKTMQNPEGGTELPGSC